MARAYCPTCKTYPNELVGFDPTGQTTPDLGVILHNNGDATNRWVDGTAGVPEDARQAAQEDESPVCSACNSEIEWIHETPGTTEAMIREARAGGMYGGPSDE